jgi:hypothetical protein
MDKVIKVRTCKENGHIITGHGTVIELIMEIFRSTA